MNWSKVALGEAVAFKGGGTPRRDISAYWGGSIPWATVKDLNSGYSLRTTQEFITEEGLQRSASNLVPAGTVIVPTRMALGKAVMSEVDVAINQDLKAAIPIKELDARFLLWFFLANSSRIEAMGKGATVKGVTLDQLRSLEVPLPPLAEQRRIAAILDKADALRTKRREAIAKLDRLLQSVFFDVFGDPIANQKNWKLSTLGDECLEIKNGYSIKQRPEASGVPISRIETISSGVIDMSRVGFADLELAECSSHLLRHGDILFSHINSTQHLCKCAIYLESYGELVHGMNLLRLRSGQRIAPYYLLYLLRSKSYRASLMRYENRAVNQSSIAGGKIKEHAVPVPPIGEQRDFADVVTRVERLRLQLLSGWQSTERLFASLQHRAFTGTL